MFVEVQELEGKQVIKVGNKTIDSYVKFTKLNEFISWTGVDVTYPKTEYVIDRNLNSQKVYKNGIRLRDTYKEFAKKTGVGPAVAMKHVNALAYKLFVAPIGNKHVKKFALDFRKKGFIRKSSIANLQLTKSKLDQVDQDGLYNVAPFVYAHNASPEELRKKFGKGAWKSICKNSFTRNQYLMHRSINEWTVDQSKISSAVLRECKGEEPEVMLLVSNACKGKLSNTKLLNNTAIQVRDMIRMYNLMNDDSFKINPNWSLRRIKEEHDAAVIKLRTYLQKKDEAINSIEFEYNDFYPAEFTVEDAPDFKAVLLRNGGEVVAEGELMGHCVGGYAPYCREGEYVVYSIRDANGCNYATLGLYRYNYSTAGHRVHFQQCYKRFNVDVDNEQVPVLYSKLMDKINEIERERIKNAN